ncbi:unnamed protein product [Darwinula stevensoni]|uniref:MYND-type domain-containing protein n=1 Tax=Darwinula stevensoni TaxID=69355 RepID=A0A7R9A2E8_9CRUS|nr:unnamed protein product [Darwinula stevensoni]CAG0879389.1 unnamed protein product [Darwinula stevensoni]
MSNPCVVCGASSTKTCSICHVDYYCTKEHQKQHWPTHKSSCLPYKVSIDPEVGQHLVAIRDVSQGQTVFNDQPLVLGPQLFLSWDKMCVSCFSKIQEEHLCSKCGFPVCGQACEESERHRPECLLFQINYIHPMADDVSLDSFYGLVTILRCLYLSFDSLDKWMDITTNMQSEPSNEDQAAKELHDMREKVADFLEIHFSVSRFPVVNIYRACGILHLNSFELQTPDGFLIQGLYTLASKLEHSCIPNIHRSYQEDYNMIARAAIPIKKGQHFTVTYADTMWPTPKRREYLYSTKYFWCKCPRCKDPTELGTYLSGIKCLTCKSGWVISKDPLDEDADWHCEQCNSNVRKETIVEMTSLLEDVVEDLEKKENATIEDYKEILKRHAPFLHPTHAQVLDVKHSLSQMYGNEEGYQMEQLDEDQVKHMVDLCSDVLRVANKLLPGSNCHNSIQS